MNVKQNSEFILILNDSTGSAIVGSLWHVTLFFIIISLEWRWEPSLILISSSCRAVFWLDDISCGVSLSRVWWPQARTCTHHRELLGLHSLKSSFTPTNTHPLHLKVCSFKRPLNAHCMRNINCVCLLRDCSFRYQGIWWSFLLCFEST